MEHLISEFNARMELKRANEDERIASRSLSKEMMDGAFFKLKGKLPFPVSQGKVITRFGKAYDRHSRLNVFKKGVDISTGRDQPVLAISSGRVAFW